MTERFFAVMVLDEVDSEEYVAYLGYDEEKAKEVEKENDYNYYYAYLMEVTAEDYEEVRSKLMYDEDYEVFYNHFNK